MQDLMDMESFQNLQDRLNVYFSFPPSIIGTENNILAVNAWHDIFTHKDWIK
jgi:hypothetical protein